VPLLACPTVSDKRLGKPIVAPSKQGYQSTPLGPTGRQARGSRSLANRIDRPLYSWHNESWHDLVADVYREGL